jgi:hypothetical protein
LPSSLRIARNGVWTPFAWQGFPKIGAGYTGREFDLETNYRVAEFKFIHWRGGPEA